MEFQSRQATGRGEVEMPGSSALPVRSSDDVGRQPANPRDGSCKLVDLGRFWNWNRADRSPEGIGGISAGQTVQQPAWELPRRFAHEDRVDRPAGRMGCLFFRIWWVPDFGTGQARSSAIEATFARQRPQQSFGRTPFTTARVPNPLNPHNNPRPSRDPPHKKHAGLPPAAPPS